MAAQVITLADPISIPSGQVVAFDDDTDTPVVISYLGAPALDGAVVTAIADIAPPPITSPGTGGGGTGHHHVQVIPSMTWSITHNLGYRPGGIVARDSQGLVEPGDITYPDLNTVVLSWSQTPVSGTADLS